MNLINKIFSYFRRNKNDDSLMQKMVEAAIERKRLCNISETIPDISTEDKSSSVIINAEEGKSDENKS